MNCNIGTKVARAHPYEKMLVQNMVIDMPVVHKIPMVSMPKGGRTRDLKDLDNEHAEMHECRSKRMLVWMSKNLGYENPYCVTGTFKLTGL